jgi:hypothetical protein
VDSTQPQTKDTPRHMSAEKCWQTFVGDEAPEAFMRRMGSRDLDACVEQHMTQVPGLFGLALRRTWRETFAAPDQVTREVVRSGIAAHLEDTRANWEAAVADLPEALVTPMQVADMPPDPTPTPESPGDNADGSPPEHFPEIHDEAREEE